MQDITYITTQTHQHYETKIDIWKQISDSYSGGTTYRDGDYLHKFTLRESDDSYAERKKRAIYFNNVQPLADLLVGFLFQNDITREDFKNEEIIEKATLKQSLDNFMQTVAVNSLLYTCGILVDSPKFDTNAIKTEADRKSKNLNPYCILYQPWQIRNYYISDNGVLEWVLLDNSRYDNSDPFKIAKKITQYRLWTSEYYQDFVSITYTTQIKDVSTNSTIYSTTIGGVSFQAMEEIPHNVGEVPFTFVNWTDRTGGEIQDTIFEDITLFDQSIFNYMSLMDEMLASGTFKFLFYPGNVPKTMQSQAFSNLSVIPWSDQATHQPFFGGPALDDIDPFLKSIDFLIVGILRKLGMNTDQEKNYVQSGQAKFFDFTKTRALLTSGATALEYVEKEIFRFAGLWMGVDDSDVKIDYQKDFLGEEAERELEQMANIITQPYQVARGYAAKRMMRLAFQNSLSEKEMDEIDEDIDKEVEDSTETREAARINIQELADQQKNNNNEVKTNDGKEPGQ